MKRFFENLKVHFRNWCNRRTAHAYRDLTAAMRKDPDYAHTWLCNIAIPILDNSHGKLTHEESNEIAKRLMKHLFGVENCEPK